MLLIICLQHISFDLIYMLHNFKSLCFIRRKAKFRVKWYFIRHCTQLNKDFSSLYSVFVDKIQQFIYHQFANSLMLIFGDNNYILYVIIKSHITYHSCHSNYFSLSQTDTLNNVLFIASLVCSNNGPFPHTDSHNDINCSAVSSLYFIVYLLMFTLFSSLYDTSY